MIQCDKCKKDNRDTAKFCKWCGEPVAKAEAVLENIVGMTEVKETLETMMAMLKELKQNSPNNLGIDLNFIIVGNAGTGKSLLGEAFRQMMFENKVISSPKLKLVDAVDFADFKSKWDDNIRDAKGGILFIDNVQKLLPDGYSKEINELDKLFVDMKNWQGDPIVVLAGLPGGLNDFLASNPSTANRFRYKFHLKDYTAAELLEITKKKAAKVKKSFSAEAIDKLLNEYKYMIKTKDKNFGNGHVVDQLYWNIMINQASRTSKDNGADKSLILPEDIPMNAPPVKSVDDILAELDGFIGMQNVKQAVRDMAMRIQSEQEKVNLGLKGGAKPSMHIVLTGNPGTGKTTVARKLGEVFEAIGFLDKNVVIEVDRSKLVGQYTGQTPQLVSEACDSAMGGILFVDEAYTLAPPNSMTEDKYGKEAVETLMKRMEDDRDKFVVIAAGYQDEMDSFLKVNPGMRSRFDAYIHIEDYAPEELFRIFKGFIEKNNYELDAEAEETAKKVIAERHAARDKKFGNGREMRKLYEEAVALHSKRIATIPSAERIKEDYLFIRKEDIPYEERKKLNADECMAELNALIGLDNVKKHISELITHINMEQKRAGNDAKPPQLKSHFVFTGNPGTGKTTVARIVANIFKSMGVLSRGHLVEVAKADLEGSYIGQTAPKVMDACDRAMGGILFIDEAYTLTAGGSSAGFGQEAIDTLLKRMEDDRGKFIVIAAGYTKEMHQFIDSNPGLKSRFDRVIEFEDYDAKALATIFRSSIQKEKYVLDTDAEAFVDNYFTTLHLRRDKNFGNAREVRRVFEDTIKRQSSRLSELDRQSSLDPGMMNVITRFDIEGVEASKAKTVEEVLSELNQFTGMQEVKDAVRKLAQFIKFQKARMDKGIAGAEIQAINIVLTGNPGTGKTTIARKLGEIFKAAEILPTDTVIEVDRTQMVASYEGQTPKQVADLCNRAMGGILFVDEAYTLTPKDGNDKYGKEAVETLMKRMEDDRGKFVVIAAGYPDEMKHFLDANPGLTRRFTHTIHINDYSPDELYQIYSGIIKKKKYALSPEADKILQQTIQEIHSRKNKNFGNAGEMVKMVEETVRNLSDRLAKGNMSALNEEDFITILPEDIPGQNAVTQANSGSSLAQLEELVGLQTVKDEVQKLINFLRVEKKRAEQGGKKMPLNLHFVFTGNPGTGKTTVARIMGDIFYEIGILPSKTFVEADRSKLVAGYIGQTAKLTNDVIDSAMGGVLFIDEAYTLSGGHGSDFGKEAIETLLKRMEDDRGKFIVMVAGYTNEMKQFLNSNPGLNSRFSHKILFEDYDAADMEEIFIRMVAKNNMTLDDAARAHLPQLFAAMHAQRDVNFGNAREIRKLFDAAIMKQADRLSAIFDSPDFSDDMMTALTKEDIE